MANDIRVPDLGESVVEVTIQRWLKSEGEVVAEGEPLVELETDKANVEISAEISGVLASISVQEGETVTVGSVLGAIGEADAVATQRDTAPITVREPAPNPPAPDDGAAEPTAANQPAADNGSAERTTARSGASVTSDEADAAARIAAHAAPAARRLATEHDVDLTKLRGSGPGGRITKEDVAAVIEGRSSPSPPAEAQTSPAPPPGAPPPAAPQSAPGEPRERSVTMTRRRRTIASRLVQAQQTAAILTTFNEVDMSAVSDLRRRRRDAFRERHGVGLGFMSFFTKAVIGALREFPYLNAEIQNDEIVLKSYYDIGIAVGVEEGLVVPVIHDADRKSFAAVEREIGELAAKARDGKLGLSELQGGTFTITNGGVYGSLMSTPILNAPQVGILGMHTIKDRPVVVAGEIVVRPMMYLALSYDHRIVDGSTAVRFLVRVKEMVEDPETLLLEG